MIYTSEYVSPVGEMLLAAREESLVGLWIKKQKYFLEPYSKEPAKREETEILTLTKHWLDRYFAGKAPSPNELCLAPEGSEFRRQVWGLLLEIPYGEFTTYGVLGRKLAEKRGVKTMSAQAIGGAVGHNPISVIIPCHRVVGADGSLTGYAGGTEAKLRLLTLEKADVNRLYIPKNKKYI